MLEIDTNDPTFSKKTLLLLIINKSRILSVPARVAIVVFLCGDIYMFSPCPVVWPVVQCQHRLVRKARGASESITHMLLRRHQMTASGLWLSIFSCC